MKKPLIEIKDLSYKYPGEEKVVLQSVSQVINQGEIVGVVGRSGVGKSTLLRLIAQIQTPLTGNILINGYDSSDLANRREYLRHLAYAGIDKKLSFHFKIKDFCMLYSCLYPHYSKSDMNEVLKEFELNSDATISSLSVGNQSKFYTAFALATNSPIIILDEITAVLDPGNRESIFLALQKWKVRGHTIIIATNLVEDLAQNVDRVLYIQKGKVLECAPEQSLSLFKKKVA